MKNYNVKESWELLPQRDRDHDKKYDSVHFFNSGLPKDVDASWFCSAMEHKYWLHMDPHYYYIHAPIFVKSLVSPYVNGRRQRSAMIGELDSPGLRSLLPWNDTDAPIFVRSLVSLHVNMERPKQASNNKRIAKVINQGKSFFSWIKCLISMLLKPSRREVSRYESIFQ
ncbi:uncharacterized protein LOC118488397 [Helianthus annuus]|uniref:uncharacterized protein LOC118488397 n=1 Tax=Helianthus annuus TaxID=4232 RepID=UPI001652C02D|nr:uncharacterized protein LOC118488397 [Helianthus annuus]